MVAGSFSLNWAALLAVICGLFVLGIIVGVWLLHEQRGRRLRVGVFVERDVEPPSAHQPRRLDDADTIVNDPPAGG